MKFQEKFNYRLSAQSRLSNTAANRHLAYILVGGRGAVGAGLSPAKVFLDDFCRFFEKNSWSSKTEILRIQNFQKLFHT